MKYQALFFSQADDSHELSRPTFFQKNKKIRMLSTALAASALRAKMVIVC